MIGDALLQLDCFGERRGAAAIRNQDVSGSAAKMRDLELGEIVFTGQVPEHQRHGCGSDGDIFAIDFHADGGEIALVKDALDEAAHQTGFADAELPDHADLFLELANKLPLSDGCSAC